MPGKPALQKVRLNTPGVWNILNHLNISQNELATRVGTSSGYLSQLLSGLRNPSAKMRRLLLEALGNPPFDEVFIVVEAHD